MARWHPASDTTLYKLANSYGSLALDNSTSDYGLHASRSDPPISWYFIPGADALRFNICTKQTGQPLCLGVSSNKTYPHLTVPRDLTGQSWTVTADIGGKTYKLSNDHSGPELYLDVYTDSLQAFMGPTDTTGRYWDIILADLLTTTPASTSLKSSGTGTSSASGTQTSSAPPGPSGDDNKTGIIAGSVGGAVVLLIICIAVYLWHKNSRNEDPKP
ncbi:hypothetical protein GGTG_04582 [Gaeumannomyces tritici R3-111a-1]|uniref:Ricin B lectin domain-containing protein n=1 Tax=Gaeumannomyces tritici (strain R3-111a-1) TaxID=644352 RepID=J3NTI2_GAET3|nr:hypothetical protein GGTG_04582 [Gaeumannomyces tritici R3-111a-1]EJT79498.1 hypothetical protein GGTG_04582 [Gaeumannomyces tritici R3-111a-1]